MKHEGVDVSITGNSTNPTRFQHLVPARIRSGPSRTTARTSPLLPAAARAVPCTRTTWRLARLPMGLTDSMGRMHGDAQFAGSSSVPAHVEMMGLIGHGATTRWSARPSHALLLCTRLANNRNRISPVLAT